MSSDIKLNTDLVWFITGASKGMGLVFVKGLLQKGYRVVGTSRDKDQLQKEVGNNDRFLSLKMEVDNEDSVKKAIDAAMAKFYRLDVIVNNAGYSSYGPLEETTDQEVRKNFAINVFGVMNVLRNVAPILRKQKSGHVINISSIAGQIGNFPGFSTYCGTKHAVDGLTESFAAEMKPFGVSAYTLNPGYFRTEFLASIGSDLEEAKSRQIADYAPVHQFLEHHNSINGKQRGDPVKLLDVLIRAVEKPPFEDPLHILAGAESSDYVLPTFQRREKVIKAWEPYSLATDCDDVKKN